MTWTLYKYEPNLQKSFAIKSSDDLAELQSLGMAEARQIGHAGVWQSIEGQEDYNLFSLNNDNFGLLLYSVRPQSTTTRL